MRFLALLLPLFSLTAHATVIDDAVGYDELTGAIYLPEDIPSPAVYRGTRSIDGEFPAMGWIGNCTATAVALDVVVTAGHCKATGSRISFEHRGSGASYPATCTRHPRYNTQTIYNDWTLCELDRPLPAGSVLGSFTQEKPAVGTKLLMNGFGAPTVGTHQWGTTSVSRYSGQDLVTCGPSNLGGGDSGGPLLLWTDDRTLKDGFTIVAVNSRGNNQCDWYNEYTHPEFQTWAKKYETDNSVSLCGISADCFKPEEPVDCDKVYKSLASCYEVEDDCGDQETMPASDCLEKYLQFGHCIK